MKEEEISARNGLERINSLTGEGISGLEEESYRLRTIEYAACSAEIWSREGCDLEKSKKQKELKKKFFPEDHT